MNKETRKYLKRLKDIKKKGSLIGKRKIVVEYSLLPSEDEMLTYNQTMDIVKNYSRIESHFGRRWLRGQMRHQAKMARMQKIADKLNRVEEAIND